MTEFNPVIPLNGSDFFQVFLERHHRQVGPIGNVSRFEIKVQGLLDADALETRINNDPFFTWLYSLRLRHRFWFQVPVWRAKKGRAGAIPVYRHQLDTASIPLPEGILRRDIHPGKMPLFVFDVITHQDGTSRLIFTWSHSLMDARGAEILMRQLGLGMPSDDTSVQYFATPVEPLPVMEQLEHARKAKEFILSQNKSLPSILLKKPARKRHTRFRVITFSENETRQIDENCRKHLVRFGKSPFLLASSLRSFQAVLQMKDLPAEVFLVPIPQDQRRKGVSGPIIGNQVSYLFYRLTDEHLTSLSTTVSGINEQMIDQMRAGIPKSYNILMEFSKRLPMRLYSTIVKSPTKGALASFFFSDTGNSLDDFTTFDGLPVTDATHYPPNAGYPGFTIVFMTFQQRLKAIVAYTENSADEQSLIAFENHLRKDLLE